jgi:hypothetical protein
MLGKSCHQQGKAELWMTEYRTGEREKEREREREREREKYVAIHT